MKVTTDACLFGAWIADTLKQQKVDGNVLEIGTGTGLLSLMLAQKTEASIDTIEIDPSACSQAKENIGASKWKQKIQVICGDAKLFTGEKKYDLIISNPPFFENQLRSESDNINMARHNDTLSLDELIEIIFRNLSSEGVFAVLLPYQRSDYLISLAVQKNFNLFIRVDVKQSTNHNYFRSILCFGKQFVVPELKELIIKDAEGYTQDFIALLKDYYLNL